MTKRCSFYHITKTDAERFQLSAAVRSQGLENADLKRCTKYTQAHTSLSTHAHTFTNTPVHYDFSIVFRYSISNALAMHVNA